MAQQTKQTPLQVQATELAPCHHKLSVSVPAARVREEFEHALQHAARGLRVDGFRPGKAPLGVVRKLLGADLDRRAKAHLFEHAVQESLQQSGLRALRVLDFDSARYEVLPESPLDFEFEVETVPLVELPAWEGLVVEAQPTEPQGGQLDQALQSLAMDYAQFDEAPGQDLDDEHLAVCDLRYARNGEDGPVAQGLRLGLRFPLYGADSEEFAAAMRGVKAGEERKLLVSFHEGFERSDWVGSQGEAVVAVRQVVKPRPATLEEVAKAVQLDGPEQLRDQLQQRLRLDNEITERQRQVFEACEEICQRHPFELPPRLLAEEVEASVKSAVERLVRNGAGGEEAQGKVQEARGKIAESAARRLRHFFVLRRIAQQEKLRVEGAELARAYQELAVQHDVDPKTVQAFYRENGLEERLISDLLERKVRAWLAARIEKSRAEYAGTAGGAS